MTTPEHPRRPEILAPAGDETCLAAALNAGADAVYLGLDVLNMRVRAAENFTRATLPAAAARVHDRGKKLYLTLNSIVFESELAAVEDLVGFVKPHVDALIVGDWATIGICRRLGVPFHISTQMSCANSAAAAFYKSLGAKRVVLARECTLAEVADIVQKSGLEIEAFVHGAQCVAESGRCLLSHNAYGCSANRGECRQPCRREFVIQAVNRWPGPEDAPVPAGGIPPRVLGQGSPARSPASFVVTPHMLLSAKDLCSLPFIDKLMAAGIASFKIEGRARNPEYVATVVAAYRAAVDAVAAGTYTKALVDDLVADVSKVFHREFNFGLFFGRPGVDQFSDREDSIATTVKRQIGYVLDYFAKAGVAQVQVQDHPIAVGDTVQIHGPSTGVIETKIAALRRDATPLDRAEKGAWVTFPCPRVRANDRVFLIESRRPGR